MDTDDKITIRVKLTSVLRTRLKIKEIDYVMPAGSTLRQVAERLASEYGSDITDIIFGADGKINLRFAVDKHVASLDDVLVDGSKVMVLGQIGGG